jgi:hypothetical protein
MLPTLARDKELGSGTTVDGEVTVQVPDPMPVRLFGPKGGTE